MNFLPDKLNFMHAPLLFLSNLFSSDMIIIIIVAMFLFGGDKLPELARGLGKGIRDFKEASENVKNEISAQINIHESTEDRRIAQAIVAQQEAARNQRAAGNHLLENIKPAENMLAPKEDQTPERAA